MGRLHAATSPLVANHGAFAAQHRRHIRVVNAGSFSAPAKQLRVGQPAISKTIAQLEGRLGVRLLLRSTHGLTPTEAGRNFYERAKRSIEEAEEAELAARGAAATLTGRLRISAPVTFGRLLGERQLARVAIPRMAAFGAESRRSRY